MIEQILPQQPYLLLFYANEFLQILIAIAGFRYQFILVFETEI